VVTFDPHPVEILRPQTPLKKICSTNERIQLLRSLGVDDVRIIAFTEDFSRTPARKFFEDILIRDLNPALIVVGHNFFFGHNREGSPGKIMDWCLEKGIETDIVGPIESDGEEISSSRIRRLIEEGAMIKASRLLGRDFSITGEIIHGDKRGRTIGVPTANMLAPKGRCIPKNGVYITTCTISGEGSTFPSITNVGIKPTFDAKNSLVSIETHIFEFNGDLYGKHLSVEFRDRLRDEMRFGSLEQLVEQIQKDILVARQRLNTI
jgi:riboflavin kinase/FMN adenylyltransferase